MDTPAIPVFQEIFLANGKFLHFAEVTKYFLSVYILVCTYLYVNLLANFHFLNCLRAFTCFVDINRFYLLLKAFLVGVLNLVSINTSNGIPFYFYFVTGFVCNFNTIYFLWRCYSNCCCRSLWLSIVICCWLLCLWLILASLILITLILVILTPLFLSFFFFLIRKIDVPAN